MLHCGQGAWICTLLNGSSGEQIALHAFASHAVLHQSTAANSHRGLRGKTKRDFLILFGECGLVAIKNLRHAHQATFMIDQWNRHYVSRAKSSGFVNILIEAGILVGVWN